VIEGNKGLGLIPTITKKERMKELKNGEARV
jgi:hypothetical protein